jgi:NADH-quinone oxidoreductase subunit F
VAIKTQRENILLAPDHRPVRNLKEYVNQRGMEGLKKARSLKPERVIEEIKRSGLRGRGGGGFPTGVKWEGVYKHPCPVKYVCCNAAEGEPGTFKDRFLLRKNPYQMLEGLAIAIHAIGAKKGYVGIKEKFRPETKRLESALGEMIEAGFLEKTEIELVKGPADYLFGEQKALLEVIEGNLPMPRVLPPHVEGLFRTPLSANPTVVNNVETLSNIPHILSKGADWFSGIGPRNCPGTTVFMNFPWARRFGFSWKILAEKATRPKRCGLFFQASQIRFSPRRSLMCPWILIR